MVKPFISRSKPAGTINDEGINTNVTDTQTSTSSNQVFVASDPKESVTSVTAGKSLNTTDGQKTKSRNQSNSIFQSHTHVNAWRPRSLSKKPGTGASKSTVEGSIHASNPVTNTNTSTNTKSICCKMNSPKCFSSKRANQSWWGYLVCSCCNVRCCSRGNNSDEGPKSDNSTPLMALFYPSPKTLRILKFIIETRIYIFFSLLFTINLLFGKSIRLLWFPKEWDIVFYVISIVCLVFFIFDIYVACLVHPNYFSFKVCCLSSWNKPSKSNSGENYDHSSGFDFGCFGISLGSFLFWCDVASLIPLIFEDIYWYVQKPLPIVNITIDKFGLPLNGVGEYEQRVIRFPAITVYIILKTARFSRLVRASTVAKITSKFNLFRFKNFLSFWCFKIRCWGKRKALRNGGTFKSKKSPGLLGILLGTDEETRRNEAAIVIQRAWRTSHGIDGFSTGLAGDYRGDKEPKSAPRSTDGMSTIISASKNDTKGSMWKKGGKIPIAKRRIRKRYRSNSTASLDETKTKSQVGTAMRELTGQRVAFGLIIALLLSAIFTYSHQNPVRVRTMIYLHMQPGDTNYSTQVVDNAKQYSVPELFYYRYPNTTDYHLVFMEEGTLRSYEQLIINITSQGTENYSLGYFDLRHNMREDEWTFIFMTMYITIIWVIGVTAFSGPVMYLVVIPIERMIKLLTMLMKDPLGYQSTRRYKIFVSEENFTKNTKWTRDVLKGMETSFLMSTILRIGSLMKVGFGSAGVDIIRKNLEKGQKKEITFKNLQGSTVSCIFLFADIRQFTDATECLQEEVFVFTNKIAEVVHSICNSYGGAANKNIGDAFLVSWSLDVHSRVENSRSYGGSFSEPYSAGGNMFHRRGSPAYADSAFRGNDQLVARRSQADKALLCVVKICIALYHDGFFMESLSETAQKRLKDKLTKRKGPIVQMGFGLHAGKAVQGAIGSQRKIDATYVSEAVELSECLESLTKRYGIKMLMSGEFHGLLHCSVSRKCRKVDQLLLNNDDEDDFMSDFAMYPEEENILELFTYDMDVEAVFKDQSGNAALEGNKPDSSTADPIDIDSSHGQIRELFWFSRNNPKSAQGNKGRPSRRLSVFNKGSSAHTNSFTGSDSKMLSTLNLEAVNENQNIQGRLKQNEPLVQIGELTLPNGAALYHIDVWIGEELRRIRSKYEGPGNKFPFQKTYEAGLKAFYGREWDHAKCCFNSILDRFDDGPSQYFLNKIEKHGNVPPRNFSRYNKL